MKRIVFGALMASLALTGAAALSGVPGSSARVARQAQATGNESVSVSPDSGTINTDFTVSGSGFAPGSTLDESFADSTGTQWQFANWNTISVGSDGTFAFTYNFGNTAQASTLPAGRWTAS